MIAPELRARIAQLEIMTKKRVSGPLLAESKSAATGSGTEFNQLRDYTQGDDVRFIDWKASARSNKLLIRQYLEDRNRVMYLAVDVSASMKYGTVTAGTKLALAKQVAAMLSFVGLHSKDAVGLILFSGELEHVISPRQSRAHVISLVNTLLSYTPRSEKTNLDIPLDYLARLKGRRAFVCLLSDFMQPLSTVSRLLKVVSQKHDLVALRCLDEREQRFPSVGTLVFKDSESGAKTTLAGAGSAYTDALGAWHERQREYLQGARVDNLDVQWGDTLAADLVRFLRYRAVS